MTNKITSILIWDGTTRINREDGTQRRYEKASNSHLFNLADARPTPLHEEHIEIDGQQAIRFTNTQ